MLSQVSTEMHD